MKRKIALLLAAVMTVAMIPATAFAKTDNSVTNVVVMEKDKYTIDYNTPHIVIEDDKDQMYGYDQFELTLEGAKWAIPAPFDKDDYETAKGIIEAGVGGTYDGEIVTGDDVKYAKTVIDIYENYTGSDGYLKEGAKLWGVVILNENTISITWGDLANNDDILEFPILAKVTGDEATITVDPCETAVSAGTYTFARTTSASATVKVNGKVDIPEDGEKEIKALVLTETVANALKAGDEIKVRLYGDFKFDKDSVENASIVSTVDGLYLEVKEDSIKDDEFKLKVVAARATKAGKVSISGIIVEDDDANVGDVAELVVSGDNVEKTTLEVGTLITYGVKFTVEDKKLPVFYSGRYYDDDETLKVTFKESVNDSWWNSRKTTLTFPEGVKVIEANFSGEKSCTIKDVAIDGNKVTFTADKTGKAEWKATFNLSISPDFTGEITCTLGGPAVSEDQTVTVAEAAKAVTFEVESKDVSIDYRNVVVGDIVIKEAFAGALEEDKEIIFDLDEIGFEKGTKVEIVEGDIQLEDLNEDDRADGVLSIEVKKESYKTPATIKLTNVQVYLDRSLPAGSYPIKVKGDAIIQNYAKKEDIKEAEKSDTLDDVAQEYRDAWAKFDKSSYTLSDKYIEVVTAGRDQDDSLFTTKLVVTIGETTMKVGQKEVTLDVPAYIADGYTMLPVRAVAEALSGNSATVLWDDATKTVTIAFGARIISMTIGSKTMNINGVGIQMNAVPVIKDNRTFLPLRDLAYALGLTDDKIAWDEATSTVTLN